MSQVSFYVSVFRDVLQREYGMDNNGVFDQWEQMTAADPLPQTEDDQVWQAWGRQMSAWLERLVDQGN
jgi:hypothetical protein